MFETTGTPPLDMDFRHGGLWPDGDMVETGVASGSKWIIGGGGQYAFVLGINTSYASLCEPGPVTPEN